MESGVETVLASHPEALAAWREQQGIITTLQAQVQALEQQLQWFRTQLFGQKSERRVPLPAVDQLSLGDAFATPAAPVVAPRRVAAHSRSLPRRPEDTGESLPFFDEDQVPVETIVLPNPEAEGLDPSQYTVIDTKVSYRLAQRPGSYVVLKYERPVIKRHDTAALSCPPAPAGVLEGSRADVSFLAGMLVDKFAYHLPLYRQHQRLQEAGLRVSRSWLTQLCEQAIALLIPIYAAQLDSIRASRVIAMDETPIKAGHSGHGKLHAGYFWPLFGEQKEVCFPYAESRGSRHIREFLGTPDAGTVLLTDGYAAYAKFQQETQGLIHAQCWSHSRREFLKAEALEPERTQQALAQIQALYRVEDEIREQQLAAEAKRAYRLIHSQPVAERFFQWVAEQLADAALLPSSPFTKALAYVHSRKAALSVFLGDPDVPIDTNHIERQIRPIPLGRKNWLFCWSELGARHLGVIQSLISTCRLHDIHPYDYLVDVLQRVGRHPAKEVAHLTPRLWKEHFAANPLRSDIFQYTLRTSKNAAQ